MQNRNYCIDLFRIIFTIGVIIGHIYCNIYQADYVATYGVELTSIHNIFTDGFFIISGIFISQGLERQLNNNNIAKEKLFLEFNKKRLQRLLGPALFVTIIKATIDLYFEFGLKGFIHIFTKLLQYWPSLFMLNCINGFPGNNVCWYVSSLFWAGILVSAIYVYQNEKKCYLFIVLFFLSFSYIYINFGNDNLGENPMVATFISVGLIRAVCLLSLGILVNLVAEYLKTNFELTKEKKTHIYIGMTEILCTCIMIYCSTRRGMDQSCFLLWPSLCVLCIVFLTHSEIVYKSVCNRATNRIVGFLSKYTYIIYLSHTLLLQNIKHLDLGKKYDPFYVYFSLVLYSIIVGILIFYIESFIRKSLKKDIEIVLRKKQQKNY